MGTIAAAAMAPTKLAPMTLETVVWISDRLFLPLAVAISETATQAPKASL